MINLNQISNEIVVEHVMLAIMQCRIYVMAHMRKRTTTHYGNIIKLFV